MSDFNMNSHRPPYKDFSMAEAKSQYIDAVNREEQLRKKLESLKTKLFCVSAEEQPAVWEEMEETKEEIQAAQQEVNRRWCKYITGKDPEEVPRYGIGAAKIKDYFGKES